MVFLDRKACIAAPNPVRNPNRGPAIALAVVKPFDTSQPGGNGRRRPEATQP
jgi:hypothetical protein